MYWQEFKIEGEAGKLTKLLLGCDGLMTKKKADGTVATGDILRLYDKENKLVASYPVVIYGDVNGDGKVNSVDLRRAQRYILGVIKMEGYFLTAADANRDGKVNSVDLRRAQRYILGILKDIQP